MFLFPLFPSVTALSVVLHVVGRSALARPQSMGSYTVGEHCTVLSFRNYTFASECVQVFSKRYAHQSLHRYTKNTLFETFPLGNHRRATGFSDRTRGSRRRSRRRTLLRQTWNILEYSLTLPSAVCEKCRSEASPVSTSPR